MNVVSTSATEPAKELSFGQWYSGRLGKFPMFTQAIIWLFYGFIWIPVLYFCNHGTFDKWYRKRMGQKKLTLLNSNDTMCLGVCSSLAKYFNMNVTIIRIIFVLSTFLGLIVYIIMAFILPEEEGKPYKHPKGELISPIFKAEIPEQKERPDWQHSDPLVRRKALNESNAMHMLIYMSTHDEENSIRELAVQRLESWKPFEETFAQAQLWLSKQHIIKEELYAVLGAIDFIKIEISDLTAGKNEKEEVEQFLLELPIEPKITPCRMNVYPTRTIQCSICFFPLPFCALVFSRFPQIQTANQFAGGTSHGGDSIYDENIDWSLYYQKVSRDSIQIYVKTYGMCNDSF